MNVTVREMRREERREASGTVRVRFENPRREVMGHLVDVSPGGFRMAHRFAGLTAGEEVDFSHPESAGRARVVWNRLSGDRVETGFLVIT